MKAIKILGPGKASVLTDAVAPKPSSSELLVKVAAVALNPTDWKHVDAGPPSTAGCDFAGVVVEVGYAVTQPFEVGDRVWGSVHGNNKLEPGNGAFAEYLVADSTLVMKVPAGASFEEAATGGVAVMTVGQGLYQQWNEMPWPDKPTQEKTPLLIWGGSSSTGALGIQFAKLSGMHVITTCGQSNFDYVKSLGADAVFDSRSPTVGADIRAYTQDKLYYAWDCIGEHGSPQAIQEALASSAPEGQIIRHGTIAMKPGEKQHRDDATFTWSVAYTAGGKPVELGQFVLPAQPDHYAFAVKWLALVEKLYSEGKIKMHRADVREGGLEGVLSGLDDMRNGRVSGVKLVYRVAGP